MKKNLTILAAVSLLMACASTTPINDDGSPTGELQWPDPKDVQWDHETGTFPNMENLSKIRPNMSRDQLYDLIGRPHFTEGFHVREWTYLFHFNTPNVGTDGVSTCEYKVLFDTELRAQNYYWKAIDPVDGACPPSGKKPTVETFTLSADALFPFNKGGLRDIKPAGRAKLDAFAEQILARGNNIRMSLRGYTDFFGSDAYNIHLSQQRVASVAQYLINRGINARNIMATAGLGKANPVKTDCPSNLSREAMIRCVAPNRRVEIDTWKQKFVSG